MQDRILAPRNSLGDHGIGASSRAVLILQVGACLNALGAAGEWFELVSDVTEHHGQAGERSRITALLQLSAYLKEAIDLYQNNKDVLNNCAALAPDDSVPAAEDMARLCSRDPGGAYKRFLARWRGNVAFHWGKGAFKKWASEHPDEDVSWALPVNGKHGSTIYLASLDAIRSEIAPGAIDQERRAVTSTSCSSP